jgi:hypothetical protein
MTERRIETDVEREILGAARRVRRGGTLRADDDIFFGRRVDQEMRKPNHTVVQDLVRIQHANALRVVQAFKFPESKYGWPGLPDLKSSLERAENDFTVSQMEEICQFEEPVFVMAPSYNFGTYLACIAEKAHPNTPTRWAHLQRIMGYFPAMRLAPDEEDDRGPIVSDYVRKRLDFVDARDNCGEEGFSFDFGFVEGKPRLHGDTTHAGQMVKDRLEELRATLPKGVSVLKPKTAAWLHMHSLLNGVEINTMRDSILDDGLDDQDRCLAHSTYDWRFRVLEHFDPKETLAAYFNTRKEVMLENSMNFSLADLTPVPKRR